MWGLVCIQYTKTHIHRNVLTVKSKWTVSLIALAAALTTGYIFVLHVSNDLHSILTVSNLNHGLTRTQEVSMKLYVVLLYNEFIKGIYSTPEKAEAQYHKIRAHMKDGLVPDHPNDYNLTLCIASYQLDQDEEYYK
jgi:hypothetical protein